MYTKQRTYNIFRLQNVQREKQWTQLMVLTHQK